MDITIENKDKLSLVPPSVLYIYDDHICVTSIRATQHTRD